jgi:hypothetical protein
MKYDGPILQFNDGLVFNHDYSMPDFVNDIYRMNTDWKFPMKKVWELQEAVDRLNNFKDIFLEEVREGLVVYDFLNAEEQKYSKLEETSLVNMAKENTLIEAKTNLADWYGDLMVFAVSEGWKFSVDNKGESALSESTFIKILNVKAIHTDSNAIKSPIHTLNSISGPIAALNRAVDRLFSSEITLENITPKLQAFIIEIIGLCTWRMSELGVNPATIMFLIMQSNFSKLDENGNPIYDERGKVLKGPNYWKPEPKIREYIEYLF